MKVLVQNRKARHDYHVLEAFEAGIVLTGTEVKSCRGGNISLAEAYARVIDGELLLLDSHIAPYEQGNRFNHEPRRSRRLLMHKKEIKRLAQQVDAKGLTLVPLKAYLKNGKVKIEIGLCRGKNVHDKRDAIRRRDDEKEAQRMMRSAR